MFTRTLTLVALLAAAGLACAEDKKPAATCENLDAKAAIEFVKKQGQGDLVILDVRSAAERAEAAIPNTPTKNLDFHGDNFEAELAKLDKSKPYLVHCAGGSRSGKTRDLMQKLGFKSIFHLDGGLKAWKAAGGETQAPAK